VRRRKPSVIWVVLAYLIPLLMLLALGVLGAVLLTDEPSPGTRCKMLGETVVRKQDGITLQCIKNINTGTLFWRVLEERK
jgi:hypothetical protein